MSAQATDIEGVVERLTEAIDEAIAPPLEDAVEIITSVLVRARVTLDALNNDMRRRT